MNKIYIKFLLLAIAFLIFVAVCQHRIYLDCRAKITSINAVELTNIKNILTYKIDSLYHLNRTNLVIADPQKRDSIWRELTIAMQADYDSRLNNVVADMRQAYNDQTTILNTYVSWWIAAYSVTIALITIGLGYINTKRAKEDLKEHKEQVNSEYRQKIGEITEKIASDRAALEKSQKSVEDALEKSQKNVEVALTNIQTVNLENNLIIIIQSITASAQMARFSFLDTDVQQKISELFGLASDHNQLLAQSIKQSDDRQQENSYLIYLNVLNVMVDALTFVYTAKVEMEQLDKLRYCVNKLMSLNLRKEEDVVRMKDLFNDVSHYLGFLCTHAKDSRGIEKKN